MIADQCCDSVFSGFEADSDCLFGRGVFKGVIKEVNDYLLAATIASKPDLASDKREQLIEIIHQESKRPGLGLSGPSVRCNCLSALAAKVIR